MPLNCFVTSVISGPLRVMNDYKRIKSFIKKQQCSSQCCMQTLETAYNNILKYKIGDINPKWIKLHADWFDIIDNWKIPNAFQVPMG